MQHARSRAHSRPSRTRPPMFTAVMQLPECPLLSVLRAARAGYAFCGAGRDVAMGKGLWRTRARSQCPAARLRGEARTYEALDPTWPLTSPCSGLCRMFATAQKTQELWMWKMEYLHHEQRPLYFGEWF